MLWDMIYAVAMTLASPIWGSRLWRSGKWRTDWPARFGRGEPLPEKPRGVRRLLIHGVSVGEINAAASLASLLRNRAGNRLEIVIATTTDTGLARAKQLYASGAAPLQVVRYPLDFSRSVGRFLDRVAPDAVALMELEVWPNFVRACEARAIPAAVVNGRLSERSYAWYRRGRALVRPSFARLAAAGVQTEAYAARFIALGAPPQRVAVLDTMKWDTAQLLDTIPGAESLATALGIDRTRPLIVAGSTGPGEEDLLLRTRPAGVQLMLVPRKPERFEEVASLCPGIVRRTQCPDGQPRTIDGSNVFLLDTIGELRKAYALAHVALVGRSFLGLYGSDPIESAALGRPTIIGPFHSDFADTVTAMRDGGGLIVTDRPCQEAARLLNDTEAARRVSEAGRSVIRSRQGSTQRHADMLLRLLGLEGH